MIPSHISIGTAVHLSTDFETAVKRTIAALNAEGFGVLTQIDVQATFKQKLDVDFPPYRILGACNPALALRALIAAPEIGMLLPCNVTIAEIPDGRMVVSIVDPLAMLGLVDDPALATVAAQAGEKLARVAAELQE